MAKRRNLKKEKAQRNREYARQFRKTSYRSFAKNKRNGQKQEQQQQQQDKQGET